VRQGAKARLQKLAQQIPLSLQPPFKLSFELSSLQTSLLDVIQQTYFHRLHSRIRMITHHVLKLPPLLLVDRQIGVHTFAQQRFSMRVFRTIPSRPTRK